jgi:hypothetical protein
MRDGTMTRLPEERRHAISMRLNDVGATKPCPCCGHSETTLVDGYILLHLQSQLRNEVIGGDNRAPCVATACTRCGYIAFHLLEVLDVPPVRLDSA